MSPLPSTSDEHHTPDERDQLSVLLRHKLRAIPHYHLPALTLDDIDLQSPAATYLPNIPTDIQLPFFLRYRALIARYDDRPIKSEEAQSMDITRAIWFYRLDSARQFQRYHDGVRWNLAIFTALLALSSDTPTTTSTATTSISTSTLATTNSAANTFDRYVPTEQRYPSSSRTCHNAAPPHPHSRARPPPPPPHPHPNPPRDPYTPLLPSATRFITLYIAAVLEHHNTPHLFPARETFLKSWKNTRWDLFTVFTSSQKKALKNEMKRLTIQWEALLDAEIVRLGRAEYDRNVGRFVGCGVPGRKDQGCRAQGLWPADETGGSVGLAKTEEEGQGDGELVGGEVENVLLDALRVPFLGRGELGSMRDEETSTVTELRYGIAAVQRMGVRDILSALEMMFPVGEV